MKTNILSAIFIFFVFQISTAQSLKKFGVFERENDSVYVIENGERYVANEKIITVKLKPEIIKL